MSTTLKYRTRLSTVCGLAALMNACSPDPTGTGDAPGVPTVPVYAAGPVGRLQNFPITDLGSLVPGGYSDASDINAAGTVVGGSST